MKILILNGSPKKNGTVATLLKGIVASISEKHEMEWIDIYTLKMEPCIACMKCRPDGECVLPEDDGQIVGRKIKNAHAIIVGTPTHWGNMSSGLKILFDRNVTQFMGEKSNGIPIARHKGKKAIIVTSCSTPWPFNFIANESRGAINSVREILKYGGYKIVAKIANPGTKERPEISPKMKNKAQRTGSSL